VQLALWATQSRNNIDSVLMLAVAFISEAERLRRAGIKKEILVLFDDREPGLFFELDLTPAIHSISSAESFSREAQRRNTRIGVHVKIDTGMGRMGIPEDTGPDAQAAEVLKIASMPGIEVKGLCSHFSEASPGELGFAREQLAKFNSAREKLSEAGLRPLCHMASSSAALLLPAARLDAVRVGLVLYGCLPFASNGMEQSWKFRPVMDVKTNVIAVKRLRKGHPVSYDRTYIAGRDMLLGVLPMGYGDGYMRAFSNNGQVLVRGTRAPVIGRVCMDLTMLDLTDVPGAAEGDEALVMGGGLLASELAVWAGTNPYEVMTSLGSGARRSYIA
jgi:alanine racemase